MTYLKVTDIYHTQWFVLLHCGAFDLSNAPATSQRLMNKVVSGLVGCVVYLDDVVIYNDSWEDHLQRIRALFDYLARVFLTIKKYRCGL